MSPRTQTPRDLPRSIGVIDIGTNSVKLTVGSVVRGRVVARHTAREPTRLGRGLSRSGRIDERVAGRTATAVKRLAVIARTFGAEEVIAAGTYAFRAARNGRAVARDIARVAGVEVRILSGAEEAAMVVASARSRISHPRRHLMVMDIGGGSVELIVTRGARTLLARSVPLGAVSLTERHLRRDPIDPVEYAQMTAAIEHTVSGLFAGLPKLSPASVDLVASGGAATTAAGVAHGEYVPDATVSLSALYRLEARCLETTIAERKLFRGLPPDRADIMPAGLAVLVAFVRHARKRSVRIVEGGVRDGVILDRAQRARRSPRRTRPTARAKQAARKAR
jgi:exopolyphosphatase / guanosine-5'-triphosphate,3'-diphosphate pyrophosphatase